MPENTFEEVVDKYVEMNIAHPFMEGNGRSRHIWLDLILKKNLKKCADWSKIGKTEYMNAMIKSAANSADIKHLLKNALTDKINSREMFMKGIDYSFKFRMVYIQLNSRLTMFCDPYLSSFTYVDICSPWHNPGKPVFCSFGLSQTFTKKAELATL